jgi:hypothetical protein
MSPTANPTSVPAATPRQSIFCSPVVISASQRHGKRYHIHSSEIRLAETGDALVHAGRIEHGKIERQRATAEPLSECRVIGKVISYGAIAALKASS